MISSYEFNNIEQYILDILLENISGENYAHSVVNEVLIGTELNGGNDNWIRMDSIGYNKFVSAIRSTDPTRLEIIKTKSKNMAKKFIQYATSKGYNLPIQKVVWIGQDFKRIRSIISNDIENTENPTDIAIKFSTGPYDGWLGISAKIALNKNTPIVYNNMGMENVDTALNVDFFKNIDSSKNPLSPRSIFIAKHKFESPTELNKYITKKDEGTPIYNKELANKALIASQSYRRQLRDKLFSLLQTKNQKQLIQFISICLKAEFLLPPYVIVSSMGDKEVKIEVPVDTNKIAEELATALLKPIKKGIYTVCIINAKTKTQILDLRFKAKQQHIGSSTKLDVTKPSAKDIE